MLTREKVEKLITEQVKVMAGMMMTARDLNEYRYLAQAMLKEIAILDKYEAELRSPSHVQKPDHVADELFVW